MKKSFINIIFLGICCVPHNNNPWNDQRKLLDKSFKNIMKQNNEISKNLNGFLFFTDFGFNFNDEFLYSSLFIDIKINDSYNTGVCRFWIVPIKNAPLPTRIKIVSDFLQNLNSNSNSNTIKGEFTLLDTHCEMVKKLVSNEILLNSNYDIALTNDDAISHYSILIYKKEKLKYKEIATFDLNKNVKFKILITEIIKAIKIKLSNL